MSRTTTTLAAAAALLLGACGGEETYDAGERALRGVASAIDSVDRDLSRARDLSFFRGTLDAYSADPRVRPPSYDGGRWTFETEATLAVFSFADDRGVPVREPDENTATMSIEITESLDRFLGEPVDVTASVRSSTMNPGTLMPSIILSREETRQLEVEEDDVVGRSGATVKAQASVVVEDRGSAAVPRYCPQGDVSGTSMAWGEIDAASGEGQRYGEATYDFEARFEGRELVWQAFDGDQLIDEGRTLTTFAQGC